MKSWKSALALVAVLQGAAMVSLGCYGAVREVRIRGVEVGLLKTAPRDDASPAAKEQLLADQRRIAAHAGDAIGAAAGAVAELVATGVPEPEAKARILAAFAAQVAGGVK